jgi:hypothetical protein
MKWLDWLIGGDREERRIGYNPRPLGPKPPAPPGPWVLEAPPRQWDDYPLYLNGIDHMCWLRVPHGTDFATVRSLLREMQGLKNDTALP